ncbi:quinone oxidoreductase family protein [Amnibacterium kyonggiense]|uniref:NADPH2:quinone reductase n=1 Tax=Amnibacterium kyonggiense TaxID=595671 RepID=A0A4R7FQB4_9MICO|nr:quinone oxidoreductase [Amnibacterium kyonggiense]TDS79923.1 NADPH2:quinone reductase [Amnibacterium kyonggiense]
MRAIQVTGTGGPEVLRVAELPVLEPGEGELLLRLAAVGVNFIDVYRRTGLYPVDLPHVPGTEGAGTVAAVGSGVTDWAVGDRATTAEATRTYAEYALVRADRAARVPEGVDLRTAAAVPLQGITAQYLVTSVHAVDADTTLLVHAGAGGVGLLLIQLAKARGARVLTTVGDEAKGALATAAGADHVLPYDGFADRVRELTGGEGVDVVYDGVGAATADDSLASLRPRGTLALFGNASGAVPPIDPLRLMRQGSVVLTRPTMGDFLRTRIERAWRYAEVLDAVERGGLDVRIGLEVPLADAPDAHRALEGRRTTGKVLLIP